MKILIIEDEKTLADLVASRLKKKIMLSSIKRRRSIFSTR